MFFSQFKCFTVLVDIAVLRLSNYWLLTEFTSRVDYEKDNLDKQVRPSNPILAKLKFKKIFFVTCSLTLAKKSFRCGDNAEN